MVEFKVGDVITLCASVWDFCSGAGNKYYIGDINISTGTCSINAGTPTCLDISGVQLEFSWVNVFGGASNHQCSDTTKLKTLGSGYSSPQGVVAITYTVSQNDLDLYNANTSFDLRVCIKNKSSAEVTDLGKTRSEFVIHIGDDIIISVAPPSPTPDYEIRYQLADNPYLSYIQAGIVDISVRLISALQFSDIPVQYVRSEYNGTDKMFKVFVKYTGTETLSSVEWLSPEVREIMKSMAIMDSIKAFAERAIVVIVTIIIAYLVASIILSGGWTAVAVIQAALVDTAIFLLGYTAYRIVDQTIIVEERVKVLQAKNNAGDIRDNTKTGLDNEFSKQPYSKDVCLTLLTGYQKADLAYIDQLSKELPDMNLIQAKQTYLNCTNTLIDVFKASAGTSTDCNAARAGFTPCVDSLSTTTNAEFNTKYPDPNIVKPSSCRSDCLICNPITEGCLLSKNTLLVAGLLGVGLVGMMWISRPKGGGTVTIRTEK